MDMREDVFAAFSYGKIALEKINPSSPNFRLYSAGWLETGRGPETWEVMKVTGAEFREAMSGPNKGQLRIMVPDSKRTVYVHLSEMEAYEAQASPVVEQ